MKNRRSTAIQSGTAFDDYLVDTHRRYTYNDRSELVSDISYANDVITGSPTDDMSGRRFEFTYDNLGNRITSNRTGVAALADDYTTNSLNQYVTRENNTLAVAGTVANSSITVAATAVGGGATQPAGRAAGFWGAEVLPNNSGAPVSQTVNVVAADPGQGSGGVDLVSTDSVTTPVAPAVETHSYDEDGNLLSDGLYSYEWDAENRLKAMQTNATQVWSGTHRRRYEHSYDYLNRRVRSTTMAAVGSSWFGIRQSTFYYEGWNLIREKIDDADLGSIYYRTYAWGLDIVGSLSSSAGVQGLIAMRDSYEAKTYLPGYDANGNVAVMLDAADGSIEAAYEYSPFGEYLRKEGDYADENPIRFSTKYTDDATNLVYYGRRYYDPKDGRFVGRDPLGEAGGINLYGFVANNTVNSWDYLGMSGTTTDEGDFDDVLNGVGNVSGWNDADRAGFVSYARSKQSWSSWSWESDITFQETPIEIFQLIGGADTVRFFEDNRFMSTWSIAVQLTWGGSRNETNFGLGAAIHAAIGNLLIGQIGGGTNAPTQKSSVEAFDCGLVRGAMAGNNVALAHLGKANASVEGAVRAARDIYNETQALDTSIMGLELGHIVNSDGRIVTENNSLIGFDHSLGEQVSPENMIRNYPHAEALVHSHPTSGEYGHHPSGYTEEGGGDILWSMTTGVDVYVVGVNGELTVFSPPSSSGMQDAVKKILRDSSGRNPKTNVDDIAMSQLNKMGLSKRCD